MDTTLEKLKKTYPNLIPVRIVKLREAPNPEFPNNRPEGEVHYGLGEKEVTVGNRYSLLCYPFKFGALFTVSLVQEILHQYGNETVFRTRNSIYKVKFLGNDQALENLARGLGEGLPEGENLPSGTRVSVKFTEPGGNLHEKFTEKLKNFIREMEKEL